MDRAVEKCVTRKFAIPVRKWHHMASLKFQYRVATLFTARPNVPLTRRYAAERVTRIELA